MRWPFVPIAILAAWLCPSTADAACPRGVFHLQTTVTAHGTPAAATPAGDPTPAAVSPAASASAQAVGTVTLYALPGLHPDGRIRSSTDGGLMINAQSADGQECFGLLSTAGDLTVSRLGKEPIESVAGAAVDANGDFFFKLPDGSVKVIAAKSHNIGVYPVFSISEDTNPGIAIGYDDNVWLAEDRLSAIGKLGYDGTLAEYPLPKPGGHPFDIVRGPENALWFTERSGRIGRVTAAGTITEYQVHPFAGSLLGIAAGTDGSVWFAAGSADKIGRITPKGEVTEYDVPTPNAMPSTLFEGSDGGIWFTENAAQKIGRVSPEGAVTEYPIGVAPTDIVLGTDGAMWFAFASGVGRIEALGPDDK